jgi:hypothetical protein
VTRPIALLLMFGTLTFAAPLKDAPKESLYLPTTVGDKRVFETSSRGKTGEVSEWVTAVEKKDGLTVVSFSGEEGGPTLYQYGASKDGAFRVSAGNNVYTPPYRLLKLPMKEGETWEELAPALAGTANPKMKYTTGKEEEVEVPAGKFRAIRVESESVINGAVIRTTQWHVVGLGIVKVLTKDNGGERLQVLKSFTPGKK